MEFDYRPFIYRFGGFEYNPSRRDYLKLITTDNPITIAKILSKYKGWEFNENEKLETV